VWGLPGGSNTFLGAPPGAIVEIILPATEEKQDGKVGGAIRVQADTIDPLGRSRILVETLPMPNALERYARVHRIGSA
jgi:hypothetical protein